jgi:hypothetical protein
LARSRAQPSGEDTTQHLGTFEAAELCNFFKTRRRRFKLTPSRLKTKILDVQSRRLANFLLEKTGEVARAHGRPSSEHINREVTSYVVRNPCQEIAQRSMVQALGYEGSAELALACSLNP